MGLFVIFSYFLAFPSVAFTQSVGCTDIKSGVFVYFLKTDGSKVVCTRTAEEQREFNTLTHETAVWDIKWISDCTYVLDYSSGLEDASKQVRQLVKRHKFVNTITGVTPDG